MSAFADTYNRAHKTPRMRVCARKKQRVRKIKKEGRKEKKKKSLRSPPATRCTDLSPSE